MSVYCVSIGDKEFKVHFSGNVGYVDGEPVPIQLTPLNEAGLHLLNRGSQAVELHLCSREEDTYDVLLGTQRLQARVETLAKYLRRRDEATGSNLLKAPMAGLVVEVRVREGDLVEAGQTLVVLESMKMQMQLRAAMEGRVEAVTVAPRQQVEKGVTLVRLAPLPSLAQ